MGLKQNALQFNNTNYCDRGPALETSNTFLMSAITNIHGHSTTLNNRFNIGRCSIKENVLTTETRRSHNTNSLLDIKNGVNDPVKRLGCLF